MDLIKVGKELVNSLDLCETNGLKDLLISKLSLLKYNNDNMKNHDKLDNKTLFKNIKYAIDILNNVIKYLILKTDNDKYTNDIKNNGLIIKLPKSIEKLVLLISYYDSAFDDFVTQKLFEIIDLDFYTELYSIYEINDLLIPFVANDSIKSDQLNADFLILYNYLMELCCNIFNLNTDLEEENYIE
jgi:hypothetical protein